MTDYLIFQIKYSKNTIIYKLLLYSFNHFYIQLTYFLKSPHTSIITHSFLFKYIIIFTFMDSISQDPLGTMMHSECSLNHSITSLLSLIQFRTLHVDIHHIQKTLYNPLLSIHQFHIILLSFLIHQLNVSFVLQMLFIRLE